MRKIFLLLITVINLTSLSGQNTFRALILDGETKESLPGATAVLQGTVNGAGADTNGILELRNIPDGKQVIVFTYIGYETRSINYNFPFSSAVPVRVFLQGSGEELEEVVITSTRSTRTIEDIPTRVETIAGEELGEKGNMKPGDIRMMLNESTGIQTQQTSATSYNSSIRIQGLDGKYTQILRDGFPLYSGFSCGLSLLQIVPLDLKQVEVIKGATSTLYGGGAISGLVNLISRVPEEKRELNFLLNATSAKGLDASGFYSEKYKRTGTTVFASYNSGRPYDPAGIGLTAIPEFTRYTLNPKFFFYPDNKTTFYSGFNITGETRTGGDIRYIQGKGDSTHSWFEKNNTDRFSTQTGFERKIKDHSRLSLKNSISLYKRSIGIPGYIFSGNQISSFSEASYDHTGKKLEWIGGLNLWTDKFSQNRIDSGQTVDYNHITTGAFIQNTYNVNEYFNLETGLRLDYQNKYGLFALPRISALVKLNQKMTIRLGGGMGYKIPTVFTEDAERIHFRNILPIDALDSKAEKSIGGNFDLNYRTPLTPDLFFAINTLFFYTKINDPLVLEQIPGGMYEYIQPDGFIDTRGVEMNIKLTLGDFRLFVGYTLADVKQHYGGITGKFPLVARHRLNNVLMYEIENKLRIGLEAYYLGPQELSDSQTGKKYWLAGLMAEKILDRFSLFINLENLTDTRQTKFDTIYTGSITNPVFRDIYAPVDGFVVNGGIKLKF